MAKRSFKANLLLILAWSALIGGCLAILPKPGPKTPEEAAADKLRMAMIRCENHTKGLLADQDAFDPEPWGDWRMEAASEDDLTFRFRARARNGFGALVWAEFECRVRYADESWSAEVRQL